MPVYNKLVPNKIPEVIKKTNKQFSVRTLSKKEYMKKVKKK